MDIQKNEKRKMKKDTLAAANQLMKTGVE